MLRAEEVAAPAPEPGESHAPPAPGATVHHALRLRRRRLVAPRRIRRRSRGRILFLRERPLRRTSGSGSLRLRGGSSGGGGGGCGGGGAVLAHLVVGSGGEAAVVDAGDDGGGDGFGDGDLELGLFFFLCFLSHGGLRGLGSLVWVVGLGK